MGRPYAKKMRNGSVCLGQNPFFHTTGWKYETCNFWTLPIFGSCNLENVGKSKFPRFGLGANSLEKRVWTQVDA